MKRVVVYVEGPSDRGAMYALLEALLRSKREEGVGIDFFETPDGDRKASLLRSVPRIAVDILRNDPYAVVVAVPDLYPRNKVFPHDTFQEMQNGMRDIFEEALRTKGLQDDARLRERFRVFCFKHDLEALVLASEAALAGWLGVGRLKVTWTARVEDQDHERPPKKVVEELFRKHRRRYKETVDAPAIMQRSSYTELAERCPQCFKPFVEFLESLQ